MDLTKPYKFIGFGAMDAAKPSKCIGFGAMDVGGQLSRLILGGSNAIANQVGWGDVTGGVPAKITLDFRLRGRGKSLHFLPTAEFSTFVRDILRFRWRDFSDKFESPCCFAVRLDFLIF